MDKKKIKLIIVILSILFGLSGLAGYAFAAAESSNGIYSITPAGSDDFNACALDPIWTFVDPAIDSSYELTGTFTDDAWLQITIPVTAAHDLHPDLNTNAPRVMQSFDNTDFTLEAKFESTVSAQYQGQGILVEQESNTDFMRFEFHADGEDIHLLAASVITDAYTQHHNIVITDAGVTGPFYMRVARVGDDWTHSYSYNGTDWFARPSFTRPITVTNVGVFALTAAVGGAGDAPTFTAQYDYFFVTSDPVVPEDGAQNNTLTLTLNTVGSGSLEANPAGPYACNDSVTITATPDTGWDFTNWSGDLSGSVNPESIIMDGPKSVTANFDLSEYTLTTYVVGSGNVTKDPDQATYSYNEVVTLTAGSDPGWTFDGWSGDVTCSDNPLEHTIQDDTTITATFTQDEYSLTVDTVGNGSVDIDPEKSAYNYNDVVTLTAMSDPGWTFDGWSGDETSSENPLEVTIQGDTTITATFTQDEYSLTVDTVGNGSVDVDPEQTTYVYGEVVTLTAVADNEWFFAGWSGDVTSSDNPLEITIQDDTTITATFTQDEYSLTVDTIGNGSVDIDPEQTTYVYGEVVTLTAVADNEWFFAGWSGDVTSSDNPLEVTIQGDTTITATFTQGEYSLTVVTVGDGSVDIDPEQTTYVYGEVVTMTAAADTGWSFAGWSGDVTSSDNPLGITIQSDTTITATFTQDEYTLTVDTVGNGSVDIDPEKEIYDYGDVVTLTPAPALTWFFEGWSGDWYGNEDPLILMIEQNTNIIATFDQAIIFLPLILR
jgi:uncharacterized repeat protein (TIGR02543 family)